MSNTIDKKEIEKFSAIADEWWSETGKFKPLHKFNPARILFLKRKIGEKFTFDSNLKILDIGCGGGLISEPMAKMGASITAIDASEKNIMVAKIHAEKSALNIDYQVSTAEEICKNNQKFDVVLALEIIEHVADVELFVKSISQLVEDNGLVFVATINRNLKSLLTAKIAAEYILRWLPIGTHDFKKFLKPSEVNEIAEKNNLKLDEISGFSYRILSDSWRENPSDISVNYMMVFKKKEAEIG
jgi:2-polyprenyl-6-hydroxyphenyl methylase/3-demethylubiquinone-9 3-methyltransferase